MNRPPSPHAHSPWPAPIWKCSLAMPRSLSASPLPASGSMRGGGAVGRAVGEQYRLAVHRARRFHRGLDAGLEPARGGVALLLLHGACELLVGLGRPVRALEFGQLLVALHHMGRMVARVPDDDAEVQLLAGADTAMPGRLVAVPAAADPQRAEPAQRGGEHHAFGVEAGALPGLRIVLRADDGDEIRRVRQMAGRVRLGEDGRLVAHELHMRVAEHVHRVQRHGQLAGGVVVDRVRVIGAHGRADVDCIDKLGMFCHTSPLSHRCRADAAATARRGAAACRACGRREARRRKSVIQCRYRFGTHLS